MVSMKQRDYIKKLCGWKGIAFDHAKITSMSDNDASSYIDWLKDQKSTKHVKAEAQQETIALDELEHSIPRFNAARAGLAMKIAAQNHNPNHPAFSKAVLTVYEAFNKAEDTIKQLYPERA